MNTLEVHTRHVRDSGRKLLGPYLTGGVTPDWVDHLRACAVAGADVIEVGLPFSDPMFDGPVIQEASDRALRRGATVAGILADLARLKLDVPLVVMTYANLVFHDPHFCDRLAAAGVVGLIVPDLPVDEVGELSTVADRCGVDLVLLASPSTPPARRRFIADRSRGFVYAVNHMGTTGERRDVVGAGAELADGLRRDGDLPVLVGFGISTDAQAVAMARHADGVAVGSALMRIVLDGASPAQTGARVEQLRVALDAGE